MITNNELFDMTKTLAFGIFDGKTYPWEVIPEIKNYIVELGSKLSLDEFSHPSETVWIAKDAVVSPTAFIGSYIIIDHNAEIRHCAFIRECAIVGKKATVGNSTELKNVLLFDGVEVPHYNYIGDSILGYKAHFGAGAVTSNLKADRKNIVVKDNGTLYETGLRKFGAALGNFAEIGCNCVLNPGTVVGVNTNIYPLSSVRGVVAENSIYKKAGDIVAKIKNTL